MKGLKKLALATAVAAAPFAQAELTAMDDAFLESMTGQAGITLDINLDMEIAEIRYADEDGYGEDVNDGGFLTLSNIVVDGSNANGQAEIRGVTIDVDGTDGIVIGFGEIGGQSATAQASAVAAVATSDYWTGVDVSADFGINGTQAGTLEVKNFTNFVPNALAVEGVQKFGYTFDGVGGPIVALTNDDAGSTNLSAIGGAIAPGGLIEQEFFALVGGGATADEATMATAKGNVLQETDAATVAGTGTNGFADALVAGNHVDAFVAIQAGGQVGEGLTINAEVGFVIQEMSFADDGLKMGIHNFTMFDTDDTTGEITGFKVSGLQIDVVDITGNATNSNATAALQISGLNTEGTIAMGDIFIGDHTNGSIGAVAIRDIDMSNTEILIYGH